MSFQKRLWLGVFAIGVFVLTIAIGNQFVPEEKAVTPEMLGHDFLAFYTAGTFTAEGRIEDLYSIEAVKSFEQDLAAKHGLELGTAYGPFWNPPFFAWIFAPLSRLEYPTALAVWTCFNVVCLAGACWLLMGLLPENATWRSRLLIPAAILVSMPFMQAISHGQNTFLSLLLVTGIVTAWRKDNPGVAGLLCGLLFYKPQLALVIAGMLGLTMGLPVILATAATGFTLLAISILTQPDALGHYMVMLPEILRYMQVEQIYIWERHVTLTAFLRLLLQGHATGETWSLVSTFSIVGGSALVIGLAWAALRRHYRPPVGQRPLARSLDRIIAATICATPLIMPFYFDYDMLLLAVPAVLFASELMRDRRATPRGMDLWLRRGWVALAVWMLINPGFAQRTRLNLTVPLLFGVAGIAIVRASKRDDSAVIIREELPTPLLIVSQAA